MGTLFGFIVVAEVEGFPMALNWGDCDFGRVELGDGVLEMLLKVLLSIHGFGLRLGFCGGDGGGQLLRGKWRKKTKKINSIPGIIICPKKYQLFSTLINYSSKF